MITEIPHFCDTLLASEVKILKIYDRECVIMRRERRKIKHIKMDLARSYSGMEAKVDNRAKEVFMRKPYSVVHTFSARQG